MTKKVQLNNLPKPTHGQMFDLFFGLGQPLIFVLKIIGIIVLGPTDFFWASLSLSKLGLLKPGAWGGPNLFKGLFGCTLIYMYVLGWIRVKLMLG